MFKWTYLISCAAIMLCSTITAPAQLAGCETTYVDWSTGTDANGQVALYAWTTTTDEAINYIPQGSCTIGAQWSGVNHTPYYHTYFTSVSITPSSGSTITTGSSLTKTSGNTNGTNTANAMDEDPCFSSDLPNCDGGLIQVSGHENTSCSRAGGFYTSGIIGININLGVRQSQWTWYSGQTTPGPVNSCLYNATCNATCATIGDGRFIVGTDYPACTLYESCSDLVFIVNGITTCVPGAKVCAPSTTGPNGACS